MGPKSAEDISGKDIIKICSELLSYPVKQITNTTKNITSLAEVIRGSTHADKLRTEELFIFASLMKDSNID